MKQIINGVPVDQILAAGSGQALYQALQTFDVPPPPPAGFGLGPWIAKIRQESNARSANANVLGGLGGVPARAFLSAAEHALSPGTGNFVGATVSITGQIPQEVDFNGVTEPGYHYHAASQSCQLWVTMVTTTTRASGGPSKAVAYRWKVNVAGGHCKVADRDDSNPFDVFPDSDTVSIPATMAGSFQYKLWARGTGISISVIQRDNNYDPDSPNFVTLNPNNPHNQALYQTNDDSCIDMMFVSPPPATLSASDKPPFYCLGRCAHPPIINTM